jgi:hypothetical protein
MQAAWERARGWGTDALVLGLPLSALELTDLSRGQGEAIRAQYSGFLRVGPSGGGAARFEARRLDGVSWPPVAAFFAAGGQYTPLMDRDGGVLVLTGLNFQAVIPLDGAAPGRLGVASELELSSPGVLENVLRVFTAYRAPRAGGLVLHSAGLVVDGGQAVLFVGRSGVGKTTLARKALAAGALVLSDDLNVVLPDDSGGFRAWAVPFAGELGRTLDQRLEPSYPLAALVLLEQGERLRATACSPARSLARLLAGAPFVNHDEAELPLVLDVASALLANVPVVALASRRDDPISTILAHIDEVIADDSPRSSSVA